MSPVMTGDTMAEHLRGNGWIRLDHVVRNRLGAQPLDQPSSDLVVTTDDHVVSYRRRKPSRCSESHLSLEPWRIEEADESEGEHHEQQDDA